MPLKPAEKWHKDALKMQDDFLFVNPPLNPGSPWNKDGLWGWESKEELVPKKKKPEADDSYSSFNKDGSWKTGTQWKTTFNPARVISPQPGRYEYLDWDMPPVEVDENGCLDVKWPNKTMHLCQPMVFAQFLHEIILHHNGGK